MKDKKLYLVSCIGIYLENEGDHSHWLFDNEEDALKCFNKQKEECISYYKDELKASYRTYYEDSKYEFSLVTNDDQEHVDIYLIKITPDGTIAQDVM